MALRNILAKVLNAGVLWGERFGGCNSILEVTADQLVRHVGRGSLINLWGGKMICTYMSYSRFERSCIFSSFLVCNDRLHLLRPIKDYLPAVEEMTVPVGGFSSIYLQHELRYYPAGYLKIEGFGLATVTFCKLPFGKWLESETGEKSLQCKEGYFCLSFSHHLTETKAAKHFFFFRIPHTCTCYSFKLLELPHRNEPKWANGSDPQGK
jgi:hypothetical protein